MVIEPPTPDEAETLTDLALRSKAVWGYDAEFIDACRAELTITSERMTNEMMLVARDPEIVGFVSLVVDGTTADLLDLFVEPDAIGHGVGGQLLDTAMELARAAGARRMTIEADPHAASWYRSRGAAPIGFAPSGSIPGRMLPLLELHLDSV